jgi:hypothetical protein
VRVRIWYDGRINMAWARVPSTSERMVVGISVGTMPNMWENTDLVELAEENTGIDCGATPDLYEPPSPLLRNPIQEFGLGEALDAGNGEFDQRYRDELYSFRKTAAGIDRSIAPPSIHPSSLQHLRLHTCG